jgi:tubulin polyglutamylase TTLL9
MYDVMKKREHWGEVATDENWSFLWADVRWIREYLDSYKFQPHQVVNHFRNHFEITRKDNLVKNVNRMRKQLERAGAVDEAAKYKFIPTSYVLPGDYRLFVEHFKAHPSETWIMKPIGKAQGRGIFLFRRLSDIHSWRKHSSLDSEQNAETYVVQRYIENPYTIGGKKFDCRLYVLVTSFSPLVVWLYRAGFARFSGTRYEASKGTVDNLEMHLTNVSIQKGTASYARGQDVKWGISELKLFMASKHGMPKVEKCWAKIQALVLRSLLAVQKSMIHSKHCVELYGYDVILDYSLQPWLLEVNASPSMSATTGDDYRLKYQLVSDMLDVTQQSKWDNKHEVSSTIGGFDLIWDGAPVAQPLTGGRGTALGAHMPAPPPPCMQP